MDPVSAIADQALSWSSPELHEQVHSAGSFGMAMLVILGSILGFIAKLVFQQIASARRKKKYARLREERREECKVAFRSMEQKLDSSNVCRVNYLYLE